MTASLPVSLPVASVLLLAGLSESAGRLLPMVARRRPASPVGVVILLVAGAAVEALVFALWPLATWSLAGLVLEQGPAGPPSWTAATAAPLVLAAVLAFPFLGPLLHLGVLLAAGAGLAGQLALTSGVSWWAAAGFVAAAGVVLAVTVEAVRRVVATWGAR